ncbi:hypothetical protein VKT23_018678 [Stygiomarasmius scandens]|uniref:Fungal-type protein kinase domain-containing protein n=1 Tax=Marasmiellus scandens TaxID=2682957 RepID=A0ABR1IRT6_9AGAR
MTPASSQTSSPRYFHSFSSGSSSSNNSSQLTYVSFPTSNTTPDDFEFDCDCSGTQAPSFYSTLSEPFDLAEAAARPSLFRWKDSVFRLPLPRSRVGMILKDTVDSLDSSSPTFKTYVVMEDRPLYVSGHRKSILTGRGSGVYPISELSPDACELDGTTPVRIDGLVLKLAWPMKLGSLETENHVLCNLLNAVPEIRDNLPEITFSALYDLQDLKELDFIVPSPAIWHFQTSRRVVDNLVVLVMRRYEKLWDAKSIEEFQDVFIDCVKCHHHAYTHGRYLHRDLSENNLMIHRPSTPASSKAKGILNDWDLAAKLDEKGDIPASQRCFRTGTKPFLSLDLLQTPPPPHQYRHDLESLFWILVWAALHYDLNGKKTAKRKEVIAKWCEGTFEEAREAKMAFLYDEETAEEIFGEFTPMFAGMKSRWIEPLYELLRLEYQSPRVVGDHWTFDNFMARLSR